MHHSTTALCALSHTWNWARDPRNLLNYLTPGAPLEVGIARLNLHRNWKVMTLGMAGMEGHVPSSASLEYCPAHPPCPSHSWAPLPTQKLYGLRLPAASDHLNLT